MHALRSELAPSRRSRSRGTLCIAATLLLAGHDATAEVDASDPIELYVADQYSFDDNLFRVPEGVVASDPDALAIGDLEDYINRASAGVRTRWDTSRQVFLLNLRLDDVRFQNNDRLDHTGGDGNLSWDWRLGSRWSGRVNAQYNRALASFSNYRFFGRDILDTYQYGGEMRYRIGSRWSAFGAALRSESEHSAQVRRVDDFESTTGRAGLEYRTPSENLIAFEYRFTEAEFPVAEALLGPDARKYEERVPGVRVEYAFTAKTRLQARAGYLEREYADPTTGDFSGEIWNATLSWEPRSGFEIALKAWHELRAYADSESDYFVAEGASIGPVWEATEKLKFSAAFATEDQDYIGDGTITPVISPRRNDDVRSGQVAIEYAPRDFLTFNLSGRWVERSSNRDLLGYDSNVISAQVRVAL
jgi:exopolysaccharide biosynthesis operon protein EpsL